MRIARIFIAAVLCAATLLSACDFNPTSWKTENMNALSPRLQPLFEKTKAVCFGRFVIDVPEATEVIWGPADVPLGISIYQNQATRLAEIVGEQERTLKTEPRFPGSKKLALYFATLDGAVPTAKHIVSQQSFSSTGMLRIDSFFAMGAHLVQLNALPLEEQKAETIAELDDIIRRLRPRAESEVPSDSGVCLDHAFLADKLKGPIADFESEHVRIGFRFKEFRDVHLSIYTAAKEAIVAGDALKPRVEGAARDAQLNGFGALHDRINFFRKGNRTIAGVAGYEVMGRLPIVEQTKEHHDMHFGSVSAAKDPFKPMFDIALSTGVKDDVIGAVPPSLTDDEAVALWDKLLSSIRVRPTGGPAKTSDASPPKSPLGELAATGRDCPQTGWWQCADRGNVKGGRRQFFNAGERMPHAVLLGDTSFWQKVKGDSPTHRVATVWELVDYEPVTPVVGALSPVAGSPTAEQGPPAGDS